MIELKNVSKIYSEGKEDEVQALKHVNLTFGDCGLYFITGKSGSGKSTMLNILGGLDSVTEGQVIVDGEGLDTFSTKQLDEYRKNKVGFIFQNFNLIEELTIEENIALAVDLKGEKSDIERIQQALKSVDLEGYETRKASKLSGGQKQRVAMARALVKSPDVILADEPTGNLDSKTSQTIFELLKDISKERLVIVVSHDEESVNKYADVIVECVDGVVPIVENKAQENEPIAKESANSHQSKSKGISARNITKLGLGFALRHKFRMIVTMILVILSLSFIGVAVTMAQSNNVTVEYSNLVEKGEKIIHLGSKLSPESNLHNVYETNISNDNAKKIREKLPDFKFNIIYDESYYGEDYMPEYREDDNFHTKRIRGVTALTEDDLTRLGMKMLAGRLPVGKNEVALPAYICDAYLEYGLYNYEKDVDEPIDSYDEIIGKTYGQYRIIVGVVDTGFDMAKYALLKTMPDNLTQREYDVYVNMTVELDYEMKHAIHNSIIVSQYYIDYYYELPTATLKEASIAGVRVSYVSNMPASSYDNGLYTNEEGFSIIKVKDYTTLADDEIIFSRMRLFYAYHKYYGKTPDNDNDLIEFCANNKISLRFGDEESYKEFKIVGIINDDVRPHLYTAPPLIMSNSFLSQYNYKDDVIWSLYTTFSGDKNKDKALVALSQSYDIDENYYFPIYWSEIANLDFCYEIAKTFKYISVGLGLVFLLFTVLMIINYIGATISSSQRQIGILKALGAGNKELIGIFSAEAILIGLIGFVFAIVAAVGWMALSSWFLFTYNNIAMGMDVNWLSALVVFVVAGITCALGCILPIKRLLKKKPIDIINH